MPGLLQKSLKGLAPRGGLSMPKCSGVTTRIVHAVRSRSSQGIGTNNRPLSQCLSKSLFGEISSRPLPSPIPCRFPLLGRCTGSWCIQLIKAPSQLVSHSLHFFYPFLQPRQVKCITNATSNMLSLKVLGSFQRTLNDAKCLKLMLVTFNSFVFFFCFYNSFYFIIHLQTLSKFFRLDLCHFQAQWNQRVKVQLQHK